MHASAQLIFSFIVSLGLPSPGNGDAHNGQLIHLDQGMIETYQWAFFQVI